MCEVRRLSLLFSLCLAALLLTGALFASETSAEQPQVKPQSEVLQEAPAATEGEACQVDATTLELLGLDVVPTGPKPVGLCNCNTDRDCQRICGERGGTCFIGPVCDDPSLTGICQCRAGHG